MGQSPVSSTYQEKIGLPFYKGKKIKDKNPAFLSFIFLPLSLQSGYAALTAVLLIIFSSLAIIGGLAFFATQEAGVNRVYARSVIARAVAEAGIEDATYRILAGKQVGASETLAVGSDSTTVSVATVGNQRTIRSAGVRANVQQSIETRVNVTTDAASFYYGVQVGDGGMTMGNGAEVLGNVYSNSSISGGTITGDATVAGGITTEPQLQWATHNADQFFATAPANRDIAQSFTAPTGGPLNKVSVYLAKVGTPASNITLRITRDSSGKPDRNGELANGTIALSSVGTTASWIDVSLASPPILTNGTKYWIVLDYGANSATNYWNWRKDATDGYADNTGRYADNWSSASAAWVNVGGDLSFRVWVGGVNTRIADATIGGTGRANLFVNDTIGGSACPNVNCIVENPPRQEMPISDGVIQDWKNDAAAGGICGIADGCDSGGNYKLTNNATGVLGTKKITGKLEIDNGAVLTVTGTLWIMGDFILSNPFSVVKLASSYGSLSGVIITDSKFITAKGSLSGSGNPASHVMVVAAKDAIGEEIITADNNSSGVIYYAPKGRIKFSNNAFAKEATAYGMTLDNNAIITYDSGLADVQFSSGPSGGYAIEYWKQVP
ncbi:MAG: choice-of-anchor R domain-containing protein [Candidatus Sungiibacteriota bacterium]